jgi:hypothetical protein
MVIEDLIVLGRSCPEEISNGRRTVCTAGYSPTHGFIRIYPTHWDSPLNRWNIVRVPVERPIRPRYNGRAESWKIVGSRSQWRKLSDKIEVVGRLPRSEQPEFISNLVDNCVLDIYEGGKSLGIIKPKILEKYFVKQEDLRTFTQQTLDGKIRIKVKDEFPIEPRIKYKCSGCRVGQGFHDQQLIEWGVYEWFRKNPNNLEQVWENLHLEDAEYEKFFFVGNLYLYPISLYNCGVDH